MHPAVVCIKWAVQRGQVPIHFSTKRRNMLANLKAVVSNPDRINVIKAISPVNSHNIIQGIAGVAAWERGVQIHSHRRGDIGYINTLH